MPNADRATSSAAIVAPTPIITISVAVLLLGLVGVFVAKPFVSNWRVREAQIESAHRQLDRLSEVKANFPTITAEVAEREASLLMQPTRILRAKSRTLAASALQSMVQDMADASHVTVTRLDVANVAGGADLPLTLSANGDIYGLTDLLKQFGSGRYVVDVDKLQVQVNSALRGAPDVLQMTLSLRAPVIVE
ncbi:MAG: GspMb/PilO family protein [Gemmatimonadaceae bacterium]